LRLGALALVHDASGLGFGLGARIGDAAQLALGGLALPRQLERAALLAHPRLHALLGHPLGLDADAQLRSVPGRALFALALRLLQLVVKLAHVCFLAAARACAAVVSFGAGSRDEEAAGGFGAAASGFTAAPASGEGAGALAAGEKSRSIRSPSLSE